MAGFVNDPPRVLPIRSGGGVWAKLRFRGGCRTPSVTGMVAGPLRYFTVVGFGPLARQVGQERLVVGDGVIVRVRDVRANPWFDEQARRAKASWSWSRLRSIFGRTAS